MDKLKITFIDNQSHGYYKVSKKIFKELNLDINLFTAYSFESYHDFYFEEDCDYPTFKKQVNYEIELEEIEVNYKKWDIFLDQNLNRLKVKI
tara:strand:+ start:512 stop:787 length:276 start_codon:yes stop_codon:yes gene_type:complete